MSVRIASDGRRRCSWCGDDELYTQYHDIEWGRAEHDDRKLFEKLSLEGFQAGLSWITILRKRANFGVAFRNFDVHEVSCFTTSDVERLVHDSGIIRHRGKIEAVINNAQRCVEMFSEEGSLSRFLWSFAPTEPEHDIRSGTLPASTPSSANLSRELRRHGWKFVGPTTMYAFMQSVGIVNDHLAGCWVHASPK